MSMECVSCAADFDHCHGTLMLHTDGAVECTEQWCADLAELRHTLIIDCQSVQGGCGCADLPMEMLSWAS